MIRTATKNDLPAIDRIYNQAIEAGFRTAHLEPLDSESRLAWFRSHPQKNYPVYLYEQNESVLGWASLSPYRAGRDALSEVAELSFYIDFGYHGRGIGSRLVEHCLERAPTLDKRILFAIVIDGNEGSIALLKKFDFERWGYLPEVIRCRGEIRGQIYMGKTLR